MCVLTGPLPKSQQHAKYNSKHFQSQDSLELYVSGTRLHYGLQVKGKTGHENTGIAIVFWIMVSLIGIRPRMYRAVTAWHLGSVMAVRSSFVSFSC